MVVLEGLSDDLQKKDSPIWTHDKFCKTARRQTEFTVIAEHQQHEQHASDLHRFAARVVGASGGSVCLC